MNFGKINEFSYLRKQIIFFENNYIFAIELLTKLNHVDLITNIILSCLVAFKYY